MTEAEADAAGLRRAFNRAAETFPRHLALSDAARAELMAWWAPLYEAIRDHESGLKILAEFERMRQLDELRRLELADTDATLWEMGQRYRALKDTLAKWRAEHGEAA